MEIKLQYIMAAINTLHEAQKALMSFDLDPGECGRLSARCTIAAIDLEARLGYYTVAMTEAA